jgi:hypothetical protein
MEHLPPLEDAAYNIQTIPLLCGPNLYSNPLPFSAYPHQTGWVIHLDNNGIPSFKHPLLSRQPDSDVGEIPSSSADMLAFLQSWLFFGVADEVFNIMGVSIDISHFTTTDSAGRSVITTERLRSYIDIWSQLPRDAEASVEHCYRLNAVMTIFYAVEKFSDMLFNFVLAQPDISDSERDAVPLVALGVGILTETLHRAFNVIEYSHLDTFLSHTILLDCSKQMIARQMENLGWCPHQIANLANLTDATGFYFASLVKRPYLWKENHGSCTEAICLGNQIDAKTYKTRHVKEGCSCQHIGINMTQVEAILKGGGTPRVTLLRDSHSSILDVVDCGPFVAISHVWSHGLGNPRNNSMPSCQLRRLASYVKNLDVPGLCLWIDTLCIPVSNRSLRTQAILNLPRTFREAHTVLVLDAELYGVAQRGAMELAIRVFCCGWMRRLWTFQEAFVSNSESPSRREKLLIQFVDGTIGMNGLIKSFEKNTTLYYSNMATASTIRRMPRNMAWLLSETKNRLGGTIRPADLMMTLASPFEYRTTSRAGDEAICLAIMLDLDMRAILDCDGAPERMKQLFMTLGEVPLGIVWADGEKVGLIGARWAPLSLLAVKDPAAMFSTRIGKAMMTVADQMYSAFPTEDGLLIVYPGLLLCLSSSRSDYTNAAELWFHPPAFMNEQGWISTIRPAAPPQGEPILSANKRRDKLYNHIAELPRPAILLRPLAPGSRFWDVAALVSVEKEEDGVLHASFQCKINLVKTPDNMVENAQSMYARTMEDMLRSLGMDFDFEQPKRIEVQVEPTVLDQMWCIS